MNSALSMQIFQSRGNGKIILPCRVRDLLISSLPEALKPSVLKNYLEIFDLRNCLRRKNITTYFMKLQLEASGLQVVDFIASSSINK